MGDNIFECFSMFKSGVTSAGDAECLGCAPTGKTNENVD